MNKACQQAGLNKQNAPCYNTLWLAELVSLQAEGGGRMTTYEKLSLLISLATFIATLLK
jgi:hypothetical protein